MAVKQSRAQQVLERFGAKPVPAAAPARNPKNEDDPSDHVDIPPATGDGSIGDDPDPADATGGGGEDDNQPHDPQVMEWMEANAGQPDGMAGTLDTGAEMMDRYMDEDDTSVYTPGDDDSKAAVEEAKGHMRQAARAMRRAK